MANKCQEIARLVMDLINKCGRVRANKIREVCRQFLAGEGNSARPYNLK